jgi:hypothetical protein
MPKIGQALGLLQFLTQVMIHDKENITTFDYVSVSCQRCDLEREITTPAQLRDWLRHECFKRRTSNGFQHSKS